MDWIHLAQDRDQWKSPVNMVMNLRVLWNVGKFLSGWATGGFSRRAQLHGNRRMFRTCGQLHGITGFWTLSIVNRRSIGPMIEVRYFKGNQQSRCLPPRHLRKETDPVSETLFSLENRTKCKNPVFPSVIHHHQNPSESTCGQLGSHA
jgi:hypothetical protein